jgi:hypothetical protein
VLESASGGGQAQHHRFVETSGWDALTDGAGGTDRSGLWHTLCGTAPPVLNFKELTRDQAAALAEVTVEQFMDCRGEHAREVRRIRSKLVNKIDALELLGKHHKLYTDRVEHEYSGIGLADRLAAALARVHGPERSDDGDQVGPRRDPPGRKAARKGKRSRPR